MPARSWVRTLFARTPRTIHKAPARPRLALEALEDRLVPAAITVNSLGDVVDLNPAVTSLRKAITLANATPENDTILFSVTGTINLHAALPYLSGNLIYGRGIDIQGPGAGGLTVRGDSGGYRIFAVPRGATVGISGLTIANGASTLFDDGG